MLHMLGTSQPLQRLSQRTLLKYKSSFFKKSPLMPPWKDHSSAPFWALFFPYTIVMLFLMDFHYMIDV